MYSNDFKDDPQLFIEDPDFALDNEEDEEEAKENDEESKIYKSVSIYLCNLQYAIELIKKHGQSARKLEWEAREEITSSSLLEVVNLLPALEEIIITSRGGFKIDTMTPASDLSRIKSLTCDSEPCFEFFSSLMPANCLKEIKMLYKEPQANRSSTERFEKFIQHQTSIKVFSTSNRNVPLDALKLLTLEEMDLGCSLAKEVIKALKCQPALKSFHYTSKIDQTTFEEVCKLSQLETLLINVGKIKDGQKLEKLTNLKQLTLVPVDENNQQSFFTFKLESLEKLDFGICSSVGNPEILEIISTNFPNLKTLQLNSTQKLNYFAKIFLKLEKLGLAETNLWELDTGIVSQNLRQLKFDILSDFCTISEFSSGLAEMFPNLEVLEIKSLKLCENRSRNHNHLTNLFAELNKLEKLKSIDLSYLELELNKEVHKINLMKISKNLKEMAQKLEYAHFLFYNSYNASEQFFDVNTVKSNYDFLVNELKSDYKIDDDETNYADGNYNIRLLLDIGFENENVVF